MKSLTCLRTFLCCISLVTTALFLSDMGTGMGALLIAMGGTGSQLAALVFLPALVTGAWERGQLLLSVLSGCVVVLIVGISVIGSTSVLSGMIETQVRLSEQRQVLIDQMHAKSLSAARLIALDRVSKAQPLLDDVNALQAQADAIPAPSGFYLAAQRVGGAQAGTLITAVVVLLALILDVVTLLLGQVSQPVPAPVVRECAEFAVVADALERGAIASPSVRNIRALLQCGQTKAVDVARIFRQLESQLN